MGNLFCVNTMPWRECGAEDGMVFVAKRGRTEKI